MTLKTKFLPTLQHPLSKKNDSKAGAQKDLLVPPQEFVGKDHPIIRAKNI